MIGQRIRHELAARRARVSSITDHTPTYRSVALTRERLIHDVWGYDFYGDDRTLDTHVKLLRKSLGRYSRCIITLRGVGYRFETVAEPESDADGDAN